MRPASASLLLALFVSPIAAAGQTFSSTSTIVAAGGGPVASESYATTSTIGGVVGGTSAATAPDGEVYRLVGGFAPSIGRADAQPSLTRASPAAVPASGAARVVLTGTRLTGVRRVTVGGVDVRWEAGADGTRLTIEVPAGMPGAADIVITTAAGQRTLAGGVSYQPRWVRYFAEGAQSAWFDTQLALFNPASEPVAATVTYHVAGRDPALAPPSTVVTVPAAGRITVRPGEEVGTGAFATAIEAPQAIVAERTMRWPASAAVASHAESATTPPSVRWYFAEGSQHRGLSTFFLLQNPGDVEARVHARYLRAWPEPALAVEYRLPARSRTTVWMDDEVRTRPSLAALAGAREFGAEFVSQPYRDDAGQDVEASLIVAERALYLRDPATGAFTGGTAALGTALLGQRWHFAEGVTGRFFDQWLLLANPGEADVDAVVQYRTADGRAYEKRYRVHAASRLSVLVDDEHDLAAVGGTPMPEGAARPLADTALALVVEASAPIVVERSVWWPADGRSWGEGHTSAALGTPATRWAVAGAPATPGAPSSSLTYLLVANASGHDGLARVTPSCDDGVPLAPRTFAVPARRRINVVAEAPLLDDAAQYAADGSGFGDAIAGRGCAFLVEAVGLHGQPPPGLVVERSTYDVGRDGRTIGAGASAAGTVIH